MVLSKNGKKNLKWVLIAFGVFFLILIIRFIFSFVISSSYTEVQDTSYSGGYDFLASKGSVGSSPTALDSYTQAPSEEGYREYEETNEDVKIQKTGSVNLEVKDLELAFDQLDTIIGKYNGFVVNRNESGEGNNKRATITLRIDTQYFGDVYKEIKNIDGKVNYASYSTDDVTKQYTDLESRLRNLEAKEDQLSKIMDTAETVQETLSVYNQLSSTRSEIEVIKGQIKYLDSKVDYGYISINLTISDSGQIVPDDKWQPLGVFKNAFSALIDLGTSVVDMLIWVLVFSPLVLVPVIIIVLIVKKKAKKEEKMV